MKITVLTDNRASGREILAEHGLSVWIEHDDWRILFDTGQSDVYLRNAAVKGIDVSSADCIVLSHGHYDHGGGLPDFPTEPDFPPVYAGEGAFEVRLAENPDGSFREIGFPWSLDAIPSLRQAVRICKGSMQITDHIWLCSGVPYVNGFEGKPEGFFLGPEETRQPDPMGDELALVIEREEGLTVFLGCSHPGLINFLEHVQNLFHGRRINTVLAGMHLSDQGDERIAHTIRCLVNLGVCRVIPMHCTGLAAICALKKAFGSRCLPLCAGNTTEI